MSKPFIFHAEEGVIKEKTSMEHPLDKFEQRGSDRDFCAYLIEYDKHVLNLLTYPCTSSCKDVWKDGDLVELDKHFSLHYTSADLRDIDVVPKAFLIASPLTPETDEGELSIYMASKTRHAAKWISLINDGVNIISTWIDEAGKGQSADLSDLMSRCITEPMKADFTILYVEQEDFIKCALVEVGAALAANKQVIIVGNCPSISPTLVAHKNVQQVMTMKQARMIIDNFTIKRKQL